MDTTAGDPGAARAADSELLALIRRGEPSAFATLMRQNNRRLYRLARSIVRNEAEAEDVVQEGYLRAFAHLDGFKGEASLATWLARIVANEALGRVRRRRPTVDLDAIAETVAATGESRGVAGNSAGPHTPDIAGPEHAAARREIRRLIEAAVDSLPPNFRAVFMLRAIEQMSIEETAACLGVAAETVKTRFHRANRLLRQSLSAQLESVFDDTFPFAGARCDRLMTRVLAQLGVAPAASVPAPSP
jgi:RNA polymerase sigma-70 factor (ECF subfamily)